MRTLASIQRIDDIQPIEGADMIVVASVLGWKVVVKKGDFQIGDEIVYLEIDSWVPHTIAPFLSKGEPREYEGVKGERLKTVRLRGQISQGLVLPVSVFIPEPGLFWVDGKTYLGEFTGTEFVVGLDVTEILGVQKWEAPIAANLAGKVRGNFPPFIRKTDEERIQSWPTVLHHLRGIEIIAHEKLDGSSMTVYVNGDDFGICSRNLNLTESEENSYWQVARKYDLPNKMKGEFAIQGELVGPGVQENKYKLTELDLYVFNVFDINTQSYIDTVSAKLIVDYLGLKWVPHVLNYVVTEDTTVDSLLQLAEGKSVLNPSQEREGLVWRPVQEMNLVRGGRVSFKTISNKFLLKGGE